jgi:hypothetical protein
VILIGAQDRGAVVGAAVVGGVVVGAAVLGGAVVGGVVAVGAVVVVEAAWPVLPQQFARCRYRAVVVVQATADA